MSEHPGAFPAPRLGCCWATRTEPAALRTRAVPARGREAPGTRPSPLRPPEALAAGPSTSQMPAAYPGRFLPPQTREPALAPGPTCALRVHSPSQRPSGKWGPQGGTARPGCAARGFPGRGTRPALLPAPRPAPAPTFACAARPAHPASPPRAPDPVSLSLPPTAGPAAARPWGRPRLSVCPGAPGGHAPRRSRSGSPMLSA